MKNQLCLDFANHYKTACNLLRKLINAFTDEQWLTGVSAFETPANLAYHTIECLDFYFCRHDRKDFKFGYRYGGSWWQLADEKKPAAADLEKYLDEMDKRIASYFSSLSDDHLYDRFDDKNTNMGWYLYALRHTLHHQGGLNALAAYHKIDVGGWDGE